VHEWQLPFALLLLAAAPDVVALAGATDAWGRNVAHMAARSGNTAVLQALPLSPAVLQQKDFLGRTPVPPIRLL
jgi:hypothetical protein